MNWETAKNWLIGLFLLLDVILAWQLSSSRQLNNGYAESQSDLLANTKTLLAEHGLTLATDVPIKQPELPSFRATQSGPSLKTLQQSIFPTASKVQLANEIGQVETDTGQILLSPQGNWQVTFVPPRSLTNTRGPLTYVYQGGLYAVDAVTSSTRHQVFLQSYKGYPIFDERVETNQTKQTLTSYSQSELTSIVDTSTPKPVISALDALDSLANSVDKTDDTENNKILSVDLGFARKVPLYQTGVAANYWFPVWRVVTPDQTYFVNAFTGEVEIAP
ncbi:two-component system regulatory protein YycI [Alicyclobacillus fastidiosus]|uniref:Two-component system regulatory protein YycI n=1 Tax=Alicyclobacillus fastidiosus TaxID=392011 RepID=A0ABY6ZI86_9BACL|nr:two-component system regulatory protein YycI [Alicyclobacillus fastidiosus]WAH41931.1 two-component system regulatory protein YycI [Alicyclobacillus fastidiosus]